VHYDHAACVAINPVAGETVENIPSVLYGLSSYYCAWPNDSSNALELLALRRPTRSKRGLWPRLSFFVRFIVGRFAAA